MKKTVQRK